MDMKIWNDSVDESPMYLRLVADIDQLRLGAVTVCVVDERGKRVGCGALLSFLPDGTISFHSYINTNLGLKLDNKGHIQTNLK